MEYRETLERQSESIDLQSEMFKGMLQNLNIAIHEVVKQVYLEDFESGDVTLKLTIDIVNMSKLIPKYDIFSGEVIQDTYHFRKPSIKHTVTTTLQKKEKFDGGYNADKELVMIDDVLYTKSIPEAQMTMEELK